MPESNNDDQAFEPVLGTDGGETVDIKSRGDKSSKLIRYSIEYREKSTNDLIRHKSAYDPDFLYGTGSDDNVDGFPAFEVVKTIVTQDRSDKTGFKGNNLPLIASAQPTMSVKIFSIAIVNAIQSVVKYYPSQDLTGHPLVIKWPYAILCHHYEELEAFMVQCTEKDPEELCDREKLAPPHLRLLLDWLDETIMPQVREEQDRNRRGVYTWEWLWVCWRPGQTVLHTTDKEQAVCVVHSISQGAFVKPSVDWHIYEWQLDFDGKFLGRRRTSTFTQSFDGEQSFSDDTRRPLYFSMEPDPEMPPDLSDDLKARVEYGDIYWKAMSKQCRWYKGPTATFPYNEVDGLAMVDFQAYLMENPEPRDHLYLEDLREWTSECTCAVCRQRNRELRKTIVPIFHDYNDIFPHDELTWHQKLLCPTQLPGFIFRTRTWEQLHVMYLRPPTFNVQMIDNLVMEERQLGRLKALAKSYARVNSRGEEMQTESWSADFVQGKGRGLVFLLHGRPGVGKTCTAECIAEFTQSPLMVLTSSDIGTDPRSVEYNLTREFKKAKSWGAVLLIDEADVFMERRSSHDLVRNSLVAGFLRALEFYDGILFLTTNRVGSFDDAFISRIHVQLYYPDFTDDQRQKIWNTFVDKLERERGGTIRVNMSAKEYLESSALKAIKWNGREIRNAFQTAVSLAEFDAKKDKEGNIMVTDEHIKAVIELSSDFKKYLEELHKKDEAGRAAQRHERLDYYPSNHSDFVTTFHNIRRRPTWRSRSTHGMILKTDAGKVSKDDSAQCSHLVLGELGKEVLLLGPFAPLVKFLAGLVGLVMLLVLVLRGRIHRRRISA